METTPLPTSTAQSPRLSTSYCGACGAGPTTVVMVPQRVTLCVDCVDAFARLVEEPNVLNYQAKRAREGRRP